MTTATDYARFVRIATIVRDTIKNGGGTWDTNGHEVKSGHAVGGEVPTKIIDLKTFSGENVSDFLLLHDGRGVGTWVFEDNVYLDVVTIVDDFEEAYALGKERGEIAIFDLDAHDEILIDYLVAS